MVCKDLGVCQIKNWIYLPEKDFENEDNLKIFQELMADWDCAEFLEDWELGMQCGRIGTVVRCATRKEGILCQKSGENRERFVEGAVELEGTGYGATRVFYSETHGLHEGYPSYQAPPTKCARWRTQDVRPKNSRGAGSDPKW